MSSIKLDINNLLIDLENQIKNASNDTKIIEIRNIFSKKYLAPLYDDLKQIKNEENKRELGMEINDFKKRINTICDLAIENFKNSSLNSSNVIDYNLDVETASFKKGSLNPVTLVANDICSFFRKMGFTIQNGEELTSVKYHFDALNVPEKHPTRESSESFYVNNGTMLRGQCTEGTARALEKFNTSNDIRVVTYGYTYRNDDDDASHSHQFHQLDFV
jgi:phenylalanyl-tRNA synthetase alpha chain